MVSSATLIVVTVTICAAFVSAMAISVLTLNARIGDVRDELRGSREESKEFRHSVEARLDGIGQTLARFDERLRRLENEEEG